MTASCRNRRSSPTRLGGPSYFRGNQTAVSPKFVKSVIKQLVHTYGLPRHGNPVDPLDDLIYILLSNRTGPIVVERVYTTFKARHGNWETLIDASKAELEECLRPAGLAAKRAAQICAIASRLQADFGKVTLTALNDMTTPTAEAYLCSLPGISLKVAKCVLMYTCDRQVLPVDVHVHRLTARLGWHTHRRADQSHGTLENLVPKDLRQSLHVTAIAHGRDVCRSRRPRCTECVLNGLCPTGKTAQISGTALLELPGT